MALPIEIALWDTSDIGEYLGVAPKRVMDRFAARPDFPSAIKLPTAQGRYTHPKWYAREVIEWVRCNGVRIKDVPFSS